MAQKVSLGYVEKPAERAALPLNYRSRPLPVPATLSHFLKYPFAMLAKLRKRSGIGSH
jgi:hypothetical protein